MLNDASSRRLRPVLLALACMLTVACIFRIQLANGFSVLIGDWLDGRIQVSIAEHWYNVFRGKEPWDTTAYFYPAPKTLGYNDGYFLYGCIHSIFRSIGADQFLAFELTNVTIRAIGFLAFYVFAVDVLSLGFACALLGAALFTLSNNVYIQARHSQLLTVAFAPALGWLMWRAVQSIRNRQHVGIVIWGGMVSILYGSWLLTAFYMAWFTTFFLALVLIAALAFEAVGAGVGWSTWRTWLRWPLSGIVIATIMCTLPFLLVYLQKARETNMHSFADAMEYSPSLLDFIHLGYGNLLFGHLDRWLTEHLRPGFPETGEHTVGFPPILVISAVAGACLIVFGNGCKSQLWRAIAIATALSFALSMHIGHFTPWKWVFKFVPGAGAIRVIARYALFLTFPVALLAVYFIQSRILRWNTWILVALAGLLLAEEITTNSPIFLNRATEMSLLRSVPQPPANCRAFYIQAPLPRPTTGSPVIDALFPHNVDAMIIAETLALPTVNGFSTFNPPGWNFAAPDREDYPARVVKYAQRNNILEGICGLDLKAFAWTSSAALPTAESPLPPSGVIHFGSTQEADRYLDSGWSVPEPEGRWTDDDVASLTFRLPAAEQRKDLLSLEVEATPFVPRGTGPVVKVEVNGVVVTEWQTGARKQVLLASIPPSSIDASGIVHLRFHIAPPRRPSDFSSSGDARRLGIFIHTLAVK